MASTSGGVVSVRDGVRLSSGDAWSVAVFPAAWLRVRVGPRRSLDAARVEAPRAVLLLDGPMFSGAGRVEDWTIRDASTGASVAGRRAGEGLFVSADDARATVARSAPSSARVVVQTWPPLVEGGRVVVRDQVGTNGEHVWRAGIGADASGRVVVAAAHGTMERLAAILRDQGGAIGAGYTDGGSSTVLWAADAPGWGRQTSGARVPAWIAAEPPAAVEGAPGAPGFPWGALGAVVLGGGILAVSRARGHRRTRA